jgi:hypothetical protein
MSDEKNTIYKTQRRKGEKSPNSLKTCEIIYAIMSTGIYELYCYDEYKSLNDE